jgi:hypothetical protein
MKEMVLKELEGSHARMGLYKLSKSTFSHSAYQCTFHVAFPPYLFRNLLKHNR